MSGRRNTRNTNTSTNNEDQPTDLEGMVARQLNAELPNLVAQFVEALNANRGNPGGNPANNNQGCSYKTFMSFNPKEFYGNEGVVGLMSWIEGMESKLYINKCSDNRKVEYAACLLQGRALTWWNTQVQTRGREAALQLTWEKFKKLLLEEYCPKSEVQKLESKFWNHAMVGSDIDKYTTRFLELAKLVPHMVTPKDNYLEYGKRTTFGIIGGRKTNQETRLEVTLTKDKGLLGTMGWQSRDQISMLVHTQNVPSAVSIILEIIRCVESVRRALGQGRNHPILALAIEGNTDQRNNDNQTRGRAFIMGANEAGQNPNVVTGTFSLNNHYATILFDSGADYNFISMKFMPLIDVKPSILNHSYKIEVANGQIVETNKIVRKCNLLLEGHPFSIDLIPFGHGSFNVIVGMNWLSKFKAEIVCHEKIVQIPLPNGEVLKVHRERPEGKLKHLTNIKIGERKLKDIPIVQDFPAVFLEDLSGLPPLRQVEFRKNLIPGATPITKSLYSLAPTELQELSNQL
ncbi:putative reverse transcriptase domain-containing protein [Tanacetum coccineum]